MLVICILLNPQSAPPAPGVANDHIGRLSVSTSMSGSVMAENSSPTSDWRGCQPTLNSVVYRVHTRTMYRRAEDDVYFLHSCSHVGHERFALPSVMMLYG